MRRVAAVVARRSRLDQHSKKVVGSGLDRVRFLFLEAFVDYVFVGVFKDI